MNATIERRRLLVSGQLVEYWEDPDAPFGWTREDIQEYLDRGAWVLLFNSLALTAPDPEPRAAQ